MHIGSGQQKTCNLQLDTYYMGEALKEARKSAQKGEVPIGAVIVWKDIIIARGHNLKETTGDPTAHAEVVAIRKASKKMGGWRLMDSTIYVTVEPCLMCMGALLQARIPHLVFGCYDPKAGACGSLYDLSNDRRLNHRMKVTTGVMAEDGRKLLRFFFRALRGS